MLAQFRNPLQIINHHTKPKDPEISFESFRRAYPSAFLHQEPINIMTSVHCELRVAMHMIKSSAETPAPIEIGVSKQCCYLCGKFLEKINKHCQKQFVVSVLQGKAYAGWRFPPETPLDLQRAIDQLVTKEVDELRRFADSKRRTNSFPTADSRDEARSHDRKIAVSWADFISCNEC